MHRCGFGKPLFSRMTNNSLSPSSRGRSGSTLSGGTAHHSMLLPTLYCCAHLCHQLLHMRVPSNHQLLQSSVMKASVTHPVATHQNSFETLFIEILNFKYRSHSTWVPQISYSFSRSLATTQAYLPTVHPPPCIPPCC